jgi:hypothetical protein
MLTSRTYVPPGTLVVPTEKLAAPATAGGTIIQKQVNTELKMYPTSGDSNAIAQQVVNRIAASAAI